MYLKRLDVHGFKSFANKTQLQFGPGVTCVVGPNGTGKTNVADSLRWVLGEHASRMLRARKTEDVIFGGSDKRAAMGLAEVSITLDNSGHWLPIEFDEVVVTRRAYRSGDNEYLINNSRVRLRDVVELFMRAQVGQNSYAFMGQGMVEQVLSLRPEDRRALVEEAADVRLYRTKLEDAQHKLKSTRENMDRVRLIIAEIEPRIRSLERQAGRAVQYQELARELAASLHVWYAHQWREVNDGLLAAIAAHDQRSEEFDHATAAAKACDDALVQLRAAIDGRKRRIEASSAKLLSHQEYVRDLERRAALDAERSKMLGARTAELSEEIDALRADEVAQQATGPQEENSALALKLDATRAELHERRERLAQVEAELLRLQRSAIADEQRAARMSAAADEQARLAQDAADAIARLRRERDSAVEERRKILNEIAAWARDYLRLHRERGLASPQLEWATVDRLRETEALDGFRAQDAAIDEELRAVRQQIDAIVVRIDVMEELDVQPHVPDAGVRLLLEAGCVIKHDPPLDVELRGVIGLVGQILRVPPGLEKAIEAALAENLSAVIVEREADMHAAARLLLSQSAGRATIYPLDTFQEIRPLHLIKERGVVGVASGLVRCDSRYRRLVDTLLGRTVVVEDIALARRIVRRGLASAVATLDGTLVRPIGSMAAGTSATVHASFVREREVAELPLELTRLRPLLEERSAALSDAARRRDEAQRRVDELSATIELLRDRRSSLEGEIASAAMRLDGLRMRMRAVVDARRSAEERIATLAPQRMAAEAEHALRAAEARDASDAEQEARAAATTLEDERQSLAATVSEQAAAVAQLDGELRAERGATEGELLARERLARQIRDKALLLERAEEEARAVTVRLSTTEREVSEQSAEITTLKQEIEPAREQLTQLESRERSLTAQLADANASLRIAERARGDAANDVRARRDEAEALRVTLDDEGFVATADGEIERLPITAAEPVLVNDASSDGNDAMPAWMRSEDGGGEDLPRVQGGSTIDAVAMRDRIAELRGQIRGLGPINEEAASEYAGGRERYDFLTGQIDDLQQAQDQLNEAIAELETVIRDRFRTTFKTVNREFERYFSAFFRGGTARLELGEADEYGLPGVEIVAQPPGKNLGSLALLSGGERSLTAVALLFALLQANPSPICVLDEVDAALDEANVGRFVEELRALAERTQFVIITHNRRTIEQADTIYGVSMGADNVSRILSLRLDDVPHSESG